MKNTLTRNQTRDALHTITSSHLPRWTRRGFLGLFCAAVIGLSALPAQAAPTLKATYVATASQGTITYTAQRAFRGGSEGKFVVNGKTFPGSAYAAVGGGLGLVWYYGTSGNMAGNALITLQPDGTNSGPIWFFNRAGAQTDSGTVTLQ
jgi:hypothetical protein